MPPAFTRGGDTSAHTGIGGSPSPAYLSQKSMKNRAGNTERLFYLTLFCQKFVLPPAPVCGLVPPPSQVRGARAAAPPALQIPICRATVQNRCVNSESVAQRLLTSSLFTLHYFFIYPARRGLQNSPALRPGTRSPQSASAPAGGGRGYSWRPWSSCRPRWRQKTI